MFDLDRNNAMLSEMKKFSKEDKKERKSRYKTIEMERYSFKKGVLFFNEGRFNKALKSFKKSTKENPDSDLAWLYKGKSFFRREIHNSYNSCITDSAEYGFKEAQKCFNKALDLNPQNSEIWLNKGLISFFIGTHEESLRCVNEAMKLEPNKFWFHLSQVHERFKHFKEAIECIDKVLTSNPLNEAAQRYKIALLNGLKFGKNYFIPLATTGILLWLIPPNKEITYTTNVKITYFPAIVGKHTAKHRINTNVLFTNDSFVCNFPIARTIIKKPTSLALSEIRFPTMGHMAVGPKGPYQPFRIQLNRINFYESIDEFRSRVKNLKEDILLPYQQIDKEDCPKCPLSRKLKLSTCSWCNKPL
ncbi:MAG: tetratricopeptide repeat protein [Candidatus Odinarchaeota archaeon]